MIPYEKIKEINEKSEKTELTNLKAVSLKDVKGLVDRLGRERFRPNAEAACDYIDEHSKEVEEKMLQYIKISMI